MEDIEVVVTEGACVVGRHAVQGPPQSIPVSPWFCIPSLHVGVGELSFFFLHVENATTNNIKDREISFVFILFWFLESVINQCQGTNVERFLDYTNPDKTGNGIVRIKIKVASAVGEEPLRGLVLSCTLEEVEKTSPGCGTS
jgi:hypothetical protein